MWSSSDNELYRMYTLLYAILFFLTIGRRLLFPDMNSPDQTGF